MRGYDGVKGGTNRASRVTTLLPVFNSDLCPAFEPGLSSRMINSVGSLLGTAFFHLF